MVVYPNHFHRSLGSCHQRGGIFSAIFVKGERKDQELLTVVVLAIQWGQEYRKNHDKIIF